MYSLRRTVEGKYKDSTGLRREAIMEVTAMRLEERMPDGMGKGYEILLNKKKNCTEHVASKSP